MEKDCKKPHEVHLANHPGYDLINQDEIINKYGPYLLTMMYIVRSGAIVGGLNVPQLLGIKHSVEQVDDINQLVDDTISYIKEAIGYTKGDTTASQCLSATELSELKSYLKVKDGDSISGGLSQMKTQKGHYPWICSDHLRQCYELALQQLWYNINASSGVWHGSEIKVEVTSEEMTQLFLGNFGKIFRIQSVENWRYITGVDLKLDHHPSASGLTTDVLSGLDDLESLSLDFGRFTLSVKGIFRGDVKDLAISIRDLGAPTKADLEFIQQCRPTALTVLDTLSEKDNNRLGGILQHNPSINILRINCDMKRHIAVIDLVCSTRENMLLSGTQPALRMFELVHPDIKLEVLFDEGSPALDMAPCINLGDCQPYTVVPAVHNFIRQHGWSAITFVVPKSFSDRLALLLDESMQETGSRIARLDITPTSLTTQGLDAVSRVINQSQGLTYLRLNFESLNLDNQLEKALFLLERHKDRLSSLHLKGGEEEKWLSRIAQHFPNNDGFPVLEEFFFGGLGTHWIKELHFNDYSFGDTQLELLVNQITAAVKFLLQLRVLDLKGTHITDKDTTREMLARVREKAPQVEIPWK
ncbi:hypothetical protein BGX34_001459 [Mortierella sp. NVP85]|nr:hypothetical protein BGX34_001459 [Mortierella sp. NVP85]